MWVPAHRCRSKRTTFRNSLLLSYGFQVSKPGHPVQPQRPLYTEPFYCVRVYLVFQTGHKQFESGQGVRLKTIAQGSSVPQSLQWSSNSKTERESKVQV